MFNYKRLTFIFIFLSIALIVSESDLEKQARKGILSFVNIVVVEGSDVSSTAPSSFLDSMELGRLNLSNYLSEQSKIVDKKSQEKSGFISILFNILYYIIIFLKFITNYVITFYPAIILTLYLFFTSRIFKKNDYGYGDYNY